MFPLFSWLIAIPVLGFLTGARSMTPIALVCFFAYRKHLWLHDTWAAWAYHPASVIVFGLLAVGELVGDKLPHTPNRTQVFPLVARIAFGGLVGALCATGLGDSAIEGIAFGAVAAFAGTFVTFHIRKYLVENRGFKDLYVAITEDIVVIGLSVLMLGIVTG